MVAMQPGEIWIGPAEGPPCPAHGGHMRLSLAMDRWECKGWDGEGCPEHVDIEDVLHFAGRIDDPVTFRYNPAGNDRHA